VKNPIRANVNEYFSGEATSNCWSGSVNRTHCQVDALSRSGLLSDVGTLAEQDAIINTRTAGSNNRTDVAHLYEVSLRIMWIQPKHVIAVTAYISVLILYLILRFINKICFSVINTVKRKLFPIATFL
jgi:hypothetical protein